jgi:hypothetical protein
MSYPTIFSAPGVRQFAEDVDTERLNQLRQWGEQHHPNGTGRPGDRELADHFRAVCKANGPVEDNWRDIAAEEAFEAFAETDWPKLRTELIQLSAVLAAWIADGDRRGSEEA